MTEHDLSTLVREHVRREEPPFLMSSDTVIALGRRTLVRRRARRGLAGVVVAAAAVVAIPLLPWHGPGPGGDDRTGIDPATAAALEHYDAQKMPAIMDQHVRATLGAGLDGLGEADFRATDDQDAKLPAQYYDKASSMSVAYGAAGGARQVVVSLMHSRGEAEGNARRKCESELAGGYAFTCTVATGADGDPVTTEVTAMRPGEFGDRSWSALTREELSTGVVLPGDPSQRPIDLAEVYFQRSVESVHSETFLTTAREIVKAPSFEGAQQAFTVPVENLEEIVTDPDLVIPKPPMGDNGCAWMLHPEGVSCGRTP